MKILNIKDLIPILMGGLLFLTLHEYSLNLIISTNNKLNIISLALFIIFIFFDKKNFKFLKFSLMDFVYYLFFIILIISMLISKNYDINYFMVTFISFFLVFVFSNYKNSQNIIYIYSKYLCIFLLLTLFKSFDYFINVDISNFMKTIYDKQLGYIGLGETFLYSGTFLWTYFLFKKNYVTLSLLIFNIFLLFILGSRGAFFSFLIIIILSIILKKDINKYLKFFVYSIFFIFLVLNLQGFFGERYQINKLLSSPSISSYEYGGRIFIYSESIRLIKENPLGIGLGSFSKVTPYSYPHNIFLEIFVELGIIGFSLFLFLLFLILKKSLALRENFNVYEFNVLMLFLASLIFRNSSFSLYTSKQLMVFLGTLILIIKKHSNYYKESY